MYVPNVPPITIYFILHKYWLNNWLVRCLSNHLECVDLSWCDLDQRGRVGIFLIPNYNIFGPNFFNFKIIFTLSIFEEFVASKVSTLTFWYAMSRRDPVGNIRHPYDGFKDVAVSHTVILWYCGHNWSLWVHPSARLYFPEKFRRNSGYSGTFLSYPAEIRYPMPPENGKETKSNTRLMCLYQRYSWSIYVFSM